MLAHNFSNEVIHHEVTVFIDGPGGISRREVIRLGESLVIGRNDSCDILLDHRHVSRTHCELHIDKEDCWISSYGINGTRINDQLCVDSEAYKVTQRDRIRIGPFTIRIFLTRPANLDDQSGPTVVVLYSERWKKPKSIPTRPKSKTALSRRKGRLIPLKTSVSIVESQISF